MIEVKSNKELFPEVQLEMQVLVNRKIIYKKITDHQLLNYHQFQIKMLNHNHDCKQLNFRIQRKLAVYKYKILMGRQINLNKALIHNKHQIKTFHRVIMGALFKVKTKNF